MAVGQQINRNMHMQLVVYIPLRVVDIAFLKALDEVYMFVYAEVCRNQIQRCTHFIELPLALPRMS